MPLSSFGAAIPTAPIGEFGVVSLRVEGNEFRTIKEFFLTQHFLTPTDPFRMTIASDLTASDARELLKPGNRVEIFIDDVIQFAGFIWVNEISVDRHSGTVIHVEGHDTMSPVVFSQVDPDHHYPDKTPLETLLRELLEPFGFENFEITNDENVLVAANLALKQKRGASSRHHRRHREATPLHQYPLAKCKPEHNDSYYQFISRILNRFHLWMWPGVDGKTIIIGAPNYDQDPIGQLRRFIEPTTGGFGRASGVNLDRGTTNIESGGIRVDASEQPSFIVARGAIPPTVKEHTKMQVVVDHPFMGKPTPSIDEAFRTARSQGGLNTETGQFLPPQPKESLAMTAFRFSRTQGGKPEAQGGGFGALRAETGTYSEAAAKASPIYQQLFKYTTKIPAPDVKIPNPFASRLARPMYMKDKHSTTTAQLEAFAKRQMSLFVRKAFVAKYAFQGFYLDGAIPQCDTIVSVIDEPCNFEGNLWVQSRTITQSRQGGTKTDLELLPIGALSF